MWLHLYFQKSKKKSKKIDENFSRAMRFDRFYRRRRSKRSEFFGIEPGWVPKFLPLGDPIDPFEPVRCPRGPRFDPRFDPVLTPLRPPKTRFFRFSSFLRFLTGLMPREAPRTGFEYARRLSQFFRVKNAPKTERKPLENWKFLKRGQKSSDSYTMMSVKSSIRGKSGGRRATFSTFDPRSHTTKKQETLFLDLNPLVFVPLAGGGPPPRGGSPPGDGGKDRPPGGDRGVPDPPKSSFLGQK